MGCEGVGGVVYGISSGSGGGGGLNLPSQPLDNIFIAGN